MHRQMFRRSTALLIAIVIVMSVAATPAMAVEPRLLSVYPSLNYTNSTANCGLTVIGNTGNEYLVATIRLWKVSNGTSLVATWYASGTGGISFSQTQEITKGQTYRLDVELMVNGSSHPSSSVTAKS